jgi:hypothetical protein
LGACSSSDEDNKVNNDVKKVISKITSRFLDSDGTKEFINTEVNNFIYTNGKLTKIEVSPDFCGNFIYDDFKIISSYGCVDPDEKTVFSYSGNNLIKTSSEEVVNELFYDSGKLKEIKTSNISDNFTKKYSSKYYFSGNNVVKTIIDEFWKTAPTITEYKYDNKNNPFKNHNLFFKLAWGSAFLGDNNAVEEIIGDTVIKYSIIYDLDNFPIKVTGINQKTGKLWTEYNYEYIKI